MLTLGTLFTAIFLAGTPLFANDTIDMILSFIGGIAFGTQDAMCPTMLSGVFKKN